MSDLEEKQFESITLRKLLEVGYLKIKDLDIIYKIEEALKLNYKVLKLSDRLKIFKIMANNDFK